ncbi:MAG: hypothetical protein HY746_03760 [Elusimicrobia bacterium]|nr:hypothetical protein [Elusimicrobiota bacterium]
MKNNNIQPASKKDLDNVKTELRTELKNVRTELKKDINILDQKANTLDQKVNTLDQKVNTLGVELAKTNLSINRMENNMMTAITNFKSEILSAVDIFAREAEDYRRKDLERGHMLMVQDDKLQNHETRITLLETKK